MKFLWLAVLWMLLSGCQVLSPPDVPATLQSENLGYVAQATEIAQRATSEAEDVRMTAEAAGTQAAEIQMVNRVLLATVRARDPLDSGSVVVNTIATPVGLDPNRRWFVKTGTSASIRESDGCVEDARVQFDASVQRIYATLIVYNITSGVQMSASWYYEGNPIREDSWVVDRNADQLCIWFDISSDVVDLAPGSWSVRLFADGAQLEEAMTFTIAPADEMMSEG
ncbi:MAG: hypothetical protein K8L99_01050 [Anaerolineae bacterium]|nr:hypothetical protein [Anaerolineae bacterium]